MPLVGEKEIWRKSSYSYKALKIYASNNKLSVIILTVCIYSSYSHKTAHTVVIITKQLACGSDPPIESGPIECKSLTPLKCAAHNHSKIHWKWGGSPQHLFQPGEQHAGDFSGDMVYLQHLTTKYWPLQWVSLTNGYWSQSRMRLCALYTTYYIVNKHNKLPCGSTHCKLTTVHHINMLG